MNRIELISEYAARLGKKVGSVTSVPLSHATPAGFAAHSTTRYEYEDIFLEMAAPDGPPSVSTLWLPMRNVSNSFTPSIRLRRS